MRIVWRTSGGVPLLPKRRVPIPLDNSEMSSMGATALTFFIPPVIRVSYDLFQRGPVRLALLVRITIGSITNSPELSNLNEEKSRKTSFIRYTCFLLGTHGRTL